MDHDIEDHERIHNLVVCVGEKGSELYRRDLTKLTDVINKYINSNTQGNTMKGLISKELISSIRMLVCKAKVYAFLTSALSNSQKAFTENLIDSLFAQFVEDIAQGNFLWVKNIFHYFAEITNLDVLHQYTFISVLNILIKQAEKSSKIIKEELMLIILSVLPFVSKTLVENCELEFKNAIEDLDRLYNSLNFSMNKIVSQIEEKETQSVLQTLYKFFKECVEEKKSTELLNGGFEELQKEAKGSKWIRKNFTMEPVELKPLGSEVVYRRCLNMHFLDLFQPEYQAQSLSLGERIIMALFLHEIILTTKTSTLILTTKLISFSYKSCEETRNFMVIDLILAEVLKTFQQNGNLVFLVSLTSILVKDNFTGHDFAAKLQIGLERLIHKINEFSFTGLEFLAAWFSHLRSNIEISFNWLKEAKKVEKGKFLISKIIRNLMQISQYSKLNEIPHLADFVDFFPAEPKPIFLLQDPNHQRHADFLMMIDKFNAKTPGEEMNQFLSSNEMVNSYGPDLQDLFVQVLLFKSSPSLSHLNSILDRYEGVLREFFKRGEQAQEECLVTIENFWNRSQFHLAIIFDKLIRRELIQIRTMSNYLIEKLTNKSVTLENNSCYYRALKTSLKVISINRKKLEADNSEKLAPIVKKFKSEFFDIFIHIIDTLSKSLNQMEEEVMRSVIGERIIDLIIDFWEDCYDSLDKIKEKISYKPIVEKFNHIHNLY